MWAEALWVGVAGGLGDLRAPSEVPIDLVANKVFRFFISRDYTFWSLNSRRVRSSPAAMIGKHQPEKSFRISPDQRSGRGVPRGGFRTLGGRHTATTENSR